MSRSLLVILALLVAGCGSEPARLKVQLPGNSLKPPQYDAVFRATWNDGSAEVATYETVRVRNGAPRKGTADAITFRASYSLDDRVAVAHPKPDRQPEYFPVLQMNWIEHYPIDGVEQQEMLTSVLALDSVDGHIPGVASKVDFSQHGLGGQIFHQLLFDASGVRSQQYSYFENEGDEQITLPYPFDGVASDALWFWARGMAAPALKPGESKRVMLLNSVAEARTRHRALKWQRATVTREAQPVAFGKLLGNRYAVALEGGGSQTFLIDTEAPFAVLHWENSDGERADRVSLRRIARPAAD